MFGQQQGRPVETFAAKGWSVANQLVILNYFAKFNEAIEVGAVVCMGLTSTDEQQKQQDDSKHFYPVSMTLSGFKRYPFNPMEPVGAAADHAEVTFCIASCQAANPGSHCSAWKAQMSSPFRSASNRPPSW